MLAELAMLIAMCAPNVHASTMTALVKHESGANPYAIGINKAERLKKQPRSKEEAVRIAKDLLRKGIDFDAGLGQINARNFEWLGLSPETVFDPCTNLRASQVVLRDCYERAAKQYLPGQQALSAAFSCYNTGNFRNGFANGYVGKVYAAAGVKIPAIRSASNVRQGGQPERKPLPKKGGIPDGFSGNKLEDGFRRAPNADGFRSTPAEKDSTPVQADTVQVSLAP